MGKRSGPQGKSAATTEPQPFIANVSRYGKDKDGNDRFHIEVPWKKRKGYKSGQPVRVEPLDPARTPYEQRMEEEYPNYSQ